MSGKLGLGNLVLWPKDMSQDPKTRAALGDASFDRTTTGLARCLGGLSPAGPHLLIIAMINKSRPNARKLWFPRGELVQVAGRILTRNTCLVWDSPWPYSTGTHSAQLSVLLPWGSSQCMESLRQKVRHGVLGFSL